MKKCGMTIKEIRHFIDLSMAGDTTLKTRYDLLAQEEAAVTRQIKDLQEQLAFLHYKMWYFKTALEAGSEEVHLVETTEGKRVASDIQRQYQAALAQCHDLAELISYRETESDH